MQDPHPVGINWKWGLSWTRWPPPWLSDSALLKPSPRPNAQGASLAESYLLHFGFHLQLPLGSHQPPEESPRPTMVSRSYFLCQLIFADSTCLGFSAWTVATSGSQDHLALSAPGPGHKRGSRHVVCWSSLPQAQLSEGGFFTPCGREQDTWIKKREKERDKVGL